MRIGTNEKIVFIGDSVTDCGRVRPVGEGLDHPYGQGYVRDVAGLLQSVYPERNIRVVNMGVNGNTSLDLKARFESDAPALKPDWLSIMVGVNDVWRQFDSPASPELWVLPDVYEATLRELAAKAKPQVKGIVLMTPHYMEPNKKDPMRARMDEYGAIVKRVAEQTGSVFVDTQEALDRLLCHMHSSNIAWDRVHPNHIGHMAIARAFLAAMEFSFDHQPLA